MVYPYFTDEELTLLRALPKHEVAAPVLWVEKPPRNPLHYQRIIRFIGEPSPEFGVPEFSVYVRRGLVEEGGFSCGIEYLTDSGETMTLARYCGWKHSHHEIEKCQHIHWVTERVLEAGLPYELEAAETDRFDSLEGAVDCLVQDYNLSGIYLPVNVRRMFDDTRR